MRTRIAATVLGLPAIVFLAPGTPVAQVPKAEDIASCNEKARTELQGPSASPRTEAGSARPADKDAAAPKLRTGTPSAAADDPQLQGIDREGAKDPAYVAAYKTCMRQSGF